MDWISDIFILIENSSIDMNEIFEMNDEKQQEIEFKKLIKKISNF